MFLYLFLYYLYYSIKCIILRFNLYFQTKKVVITDLHEMIVNLYQDILLCFLKREYVTSNLSNVNPKNGQYQLINRQLYLGAKVMLHIDSQEVIEDSTCRTDFFERYRKMYSYKTTLSIIFFFR